MTRSPASSPTCSSNGLLRPRPAPVGGGSGRLGGDDHIPGGSRSAATCRRARSGRTPVPPPDPRREPPRCQRPPAELRSAGSRRRSSAGPQPRRRPTRTLLPVPPVAPSPHYPLAPRGGGEGVPGALHAGGQAAVDDGVGAEGADPHVGDGRG